MRCQDFRKYLSPYLDSELDARTCADIAEHLSLCEHCSSFFAQEQEIERCLAKALQRAKMPEESWRVILEGINAYDSARSRRVRLAWLIPAAVVPVAAMVMVWFFIWGKAPDAHLLAKPLLEMHEKYMSQEIANKGLSLPQGFEELPVIKHLPQSGFIGGHDVKLIGGQPCYIKKKVKGAHIMYSCCNAPVSMFILRREDMGAFKGAQKLLDQGKGSAVVNLGNARLAMKDLKEAVVCCVSSHDTSELLTAFEHL